MRKILLPLLFISLLFGCSLDRQAGRPQPQKTGGSVTLPQEKAVKENKSNILTKVKEDERYAYYDGEITISGKYWECAAGLLCQTLCFYPDETTSSLIPKDLNDRRLARFCFNNQDKAKSAFGVSDNEIFKDSRFKEPESNCKIEGDATVKISNYAVLKMQTAGYDKADLIEIISKSEYVRKC